MLIESFISRKEKFSFAIGIELFREYDVVTGKQVGDLFGFQPRTNTALCKKWVEAGFLEIVDPSLKSRKYSLASKYKKLLG